MFELTPQNAAAYLDSREGFRGRRWRVRPLGGGVSNIVLLAEAAGMRMVLKQSLPKLRVEEDWPADRNRIEREWRAIQNLEGHLPPGAVPEVYFTDSPKYLFAMSATPESAVTWKAALMDGVCQPETAARVAHIHGAMIRATWESPSWERDFGDLHAFGQLRLDPYHEFTASRHPDLAAAIRSRIQDARTRCRCAVHGDWSPKNFLVDGPSVTAIDWEVIHFGDPSFDAAFLLNHLVLKAFHLPRLAGRFRELAMIYWRELEPLLPGAARGWFETGTCRHLGCLLLARIDGKSPAEYITDDKVRRHIRDRARELILDPPERIAALLQETIA